MRLKLPVVVPENVINPGDSALQLEYPWIVPEAARLLSTVLDTGDRVLDLGTGGSTLFFARRCESVLGLETERRWYPKVAAAVEASGLTNVSVKLVEGEATRDLQVFYQNTLNKLLERLGQAERNWNVLSVDTMHYFSRSQLLSAARGPRLDVLVLDNWTCGGMWPGTCALDKPQLLDYLGLEANDYEVHDFRLPGWSGSGTRLVISTSRL